MLIHYGIYYVLLPFMSANMAYTIGYFLSFLCNFLMSSYFTFRVYPTWKRLFRFAGSHGINYLVYIGLFNFFLWTGVPEVWAPFPVYLIAVPISFLLVRLAMVAKRNPTHPPYPPPGLTPGPSPGLTPGPSPEGEGNGGEIGIYGVHVKFKK